MSSPIAYVPEVEEKPETEAEIGARAVRLLEIMGVRRPISALLRVGHVGVFLIREATR